MHFYTDTPVGIQPRHFVPMAKDPSRTRPSRVTDAKKAAKAGEIWYPSVTSVLNILDKPALNNWKVDQHLQTVWDLGEELADCGSYDEFFGIVKAQTQERLDAAPQAGTDIHKVLEDWLFKDRSQAEITPTEIMICDNVEKELLNREISDPMIEQYFINKEYGYAGCCDLFTDEWVIDYKSKQEASKFKPGRMAYPEQTRQLAAYGRSLCQPGFRGANIFICLETGEIDFHEHSDDSLIYAWSDFLDCLSIYQRNTYKA